MFSRRIDRINERERGPVRIVDIRASGPYNRHSIEIVYLFLLEG